MFLGIDLGTSNSAIVGHDGKTLRLFKTADGLDVLSSAIMIDRRGAKLVGKRAYDQAAFSPENVAQGFKRLMGTASVLSFGVSGQTVSPEAASAEIVRTLVAQAKMAAGEFEVEGAVITVPAAFNQMQSEATMRAAHEAGLPKVALLQEPIAAALASVASSATKSSLFLVYDLGGGTFDAALVQSISGSATVVGHSGINMLGGRDFDRALVNEIVRPWLFDNFDLDEDFQKDPACQRLLRVAQYRAELAKIALSTQMSDRIFADETQISTKDRKGQDIYLDVEVSRADLEQLIGADVDLSISHCRQMIENSGYRAEDIDRAVMIGGPSRMPIVRERVETQLGIRVDLQTDPMTAVAMGAAIYAEGRDWSADSATAKRSRGTSASRGKIELTVNYPARTADARVRLRIQPADSSLAAGYRVQAETDSGWSSGQLELNAQTDIKDVPLEKSGSTRIRITVFDPTGVVDKAASQEIFVQRAEATSDGMPLMHGIAVQIVEGPPGAEHNVLDPLVDKGTSLPKAGVKMFRAAKDLRYGQDDTIDIALFEQAEGVTDPSLSLPIGVFRLQSKFLERGDVIRRGDEMFVHWTIDGNGLLACRIAVPAVSASYESNNMYVSAVGHRNFDGDDGFRIAADGINAARSDLEALEKALGVAVSKEAGAIRKRLYRCEEMLRLSHDADARRSISEEARVVRQEISRIRSRPEHEARVVRHDLESTVDFFSDRLAPQMDPKKGAQVHRLAAMARDSLDRNTQQATNDAKKTTEEIQQIIRAELLKSIGFWAAVFDADATERHRAIDKSLHDRLVNEGAQAMEAQDLAALSSVVWRMRDNMMQTSSPSEIGTLAGLMRGK